MRWGVVRSDAFGTFVGQKWVERYWHPINSMGYRDREHDWTALAGRNKVFVVGDSFVAGQGLEDIRYRFSSLFQDRLGPGYEVATIADCGWDTDFELASLQAYPAKPDVVVLAYVPNDIEGAARRLGAAFDFMSVLPPPALAEIVHSSYLLNYLYFGIYAPRKLTGYTDFLLQCHSTEAISRLHEETLSAFAYYVHSTGASLIVLVFPLLNAIEQTAPITKKVAAFFEAQGATAIDLGAHFAGRRVQDLVVSASDAHPNRAVNAEVAGILEKVFKEGLGPQGQKDGAGGNVAGGTRGE